VVKQISVQQLAESIDAGERVFLVDVRQQWEHDTAALPGSVLAPLDQLPQSARELQAPDDSRIVVYCHHGIRSLSGAALLESMGFQNVVSLAGGIDAWSKLVDASVPRY
jgi:rhodanese-related sulfurtransferase